MVGNYYWKSGEVPIIISGLKDPIVKNIQSIQVGKKQKIAILFEEIMDVMGLDLNDDSLKGTPQRVAKMYIDEIFSGLDPKNKPKIEKIDRSFLFDIVGQNKHLLV